MIVNEKTAIVGHDVVLVPYRSEHVETYHRWMLSPELRELTASEQLTLEEEHEMQRKWRTDTDKLTFIILARPHIFSEAPANDSTRDIIPSQSEISTYPMVGDVNLFLKGNPEEEEVFEVEVEVMIAEAAYRRQGIASSALHLMFHYATSPAGHPTLRIPPERLVARIGEANTASIRLFQKLSFHITRRVPIFQEMELRYQGVGNWTQGECVMFD